MPGLGRVSENMAESVTDAVGDSVRGTELRRAGKAGEPWKRQSTVRACGSQRGIRSVIQTGSGAKGGQVPGTRPYQPKIAEQRRGSRQNQENGPRRQAVPEEHQRTANSAAMASNSATPWQKPMRCAGCGITPWAPRNPACVLRRETVAASPRRLGNRAPEVRWADQRVQRRNVEQG